MIEGRNKMKNKKRNIREVLKEVVCMRLLKIIIFTLFVFTLQLSTSNQQLCYASFEDIGVGARPLGMGNAFCAIADDANAFLYNPAGLAQLERLQISTMYANLYPILSDGSGISNNFISIAYPIPVDILMPASFPLWLTKDGWGTIGFSWFNLGTSSDPLRSASTYKENTYIFSYAKNLDLFMLGLSMKILTKEYGQNYWTSMNPVFANGCNAYGLGFDVGALYKMPGEKLTLGLQLKDINQPDIHLVYASPVPLTFRFGAAYKLVPVWNFDRITASSDFTVRDSDFKLYSGIEGWLIDKNIALRFGFGLGSGFSNIALGASYKLTEEMYNSDFRLDYAFVYPFGAQPTGGTHRISLTMGLGDTK